MQNLIAVPVPRGIDCRSPLVKQCSTTWHVASGSARAYEPLSYPCDEERSLYVRQNAIDMRSLYCTCPFELVLPDVPNNDLGVVGAMRSAVKGARALGVGDPTFYSAALAASVTLTGIGAAIRISCGVYVKIAFDIPTTQAITARLQTTGAVTAFGAVAINRDITFTMLASGCQTVELFAAFAAPDAANFQVWSPRIDATTPAAKTIVVSGLPAVGSGTISGQWVGVNSQFLPGIAGAILHARD